MGANELSFLERAILAISPRTAATRARDRIIFETLRAYEGAAKGRRVNGWKAGSTSANSEISVSHVTLRNRARALVRDNSYAARGIRYITNNVVGYGITTTPITGNKKTNKALKDVWRQWAESAQCDADGLHTIYGLQRLAMRAIAESGEVLIRLRRRKSSDGLKVPIQIQLLEADFIDSTKTGTTQGGNILLQGKEYDKIGRLVAYWLFENHPGDSFVVGKSFVSKRVDAEDIIHIYRVDRPGQVRGVSWLAPVIISLRDFDEYEDSQLVRQKIAACFTAFITDNENEDPSKKQETEKMEPGLIYKLPHGQTVTFASPPDVQGYAEFSSVTLHKVSVGLGVPYEGLTGDWSLVNFTSGRMGKVDFYGELDDWQWLMFIPRFCEGIFSWFRDAAIIAGYPADGATARYTPPRRQMTDPTREIPAEIKEIRGGLKSLIQAARERGMDPEEFLDEIKESNQMLDDRKIIVDSDPRKITSSGQAQIEPSDSIPPEDTPAKPKD